MAISYTAAVRNNFADSVLADLGNAGLIRIYDGTPPANVDAALSGNNTLATATLPTPSGVVTTHTLDLDLDPDVEVTAAATGTASFFRILTSGGTAIAQGTCGTSGTDMILTSTSITSGQTVRFTLASLSFPNP
jgi:hypothetical protein